MPANVDSIRQLVDLMVENDLNEIDIAHGRTKIVLRRGGVVPPVGPSAAAAAPQAPAEAPAEQELIAIKSPMVGTFFAAASPDSDSFVTVGAGVSEDTVVCIIEAMKVMNEIKAECTGTIAEVCIKNAQPVEFGQVLFKVNPA
jgi:acetyl-CoA carboxylase biotin carboxyl carrier protein